MGAVVAAAVGLVVFGLVFGVLQRFWPATVGPSRCRRQWLTDLSYWFATPLVLKPLSRAIVFGVAVAVALAAGATGPGLLDTFSSRSPIGAQPIWLQSIEALILADFLGYWMHRALHRGWLWRLHAVHHSSTTLDWLAAVRNHPLAEVVAAIPRLLLLLLLGFDLPALVIGLPVFGLFALLLHANVRWDFGPLRTIIASPAFHRWHHSCDPQARDKNFGGLLAIWDVYFGTYYLPEDQPAQHFGVAHDPPPPTFWGGLAHPFRAPR